MIKSILLVGVGGQGTILSAKVISNAIISLGLDVKMSEIHGMSQRGGNVSTEVRFATNKGEKVFSPTISSGEADYLIAFEEMEALRYAHMLKNDGVLIVNKYNIPSLQILTGESEYPTGIIAKLERYTKNIEVIEAHKIANELGNPKVMNIVLLGALSKHLPELDLEDAIKNTVKEKLLEVNLKAFNYS